NSRSSVQIRVSAPPPSPAQARGLRRTDATRDPPVAARTPDGPPAKLAGLRRFPSWTPCRMALGLGRHRLSRCSGSRCRGMAKLIYATNVSLDGYIAEDRK